MDESFFGCTRKGKRGRGADGKLSIFGLLKLGGRVYTKIIPDACSAKLIPITARKVIPTALSILISGGQKMQSSSMSPYHKNAKASAKRLGRKLALLAVLANSLGR